MFTVAQDGSGDARTIQEAADRAERNETGRIEILVRPGIYRERVVITRDHLLLRGEDRDTTVLTWSACAKDPDAEGKEKGTFLSFTLLVTGADVTVENMTVRNDAGEGWLVGQAVAVYAAGDRGTWRNCRLTAHQDTLYCGPMMPNVEAEIAPRTHGTFRAMRTGECPMPQGRQLFEDCLIRGDVDFIFGPYRCWFERCTLYMNKRGGFYTAANTPEEADYGFVFRDCLLTGECEPGEGYLGRPWRKFCRTLFLNCEMDEHVAPAGFMDWDAERLVTDRCGEWNTRGARADMLFRHPSEKRLTAEEAGKVTRQAVLGDDAEWEMSGWK